MASLFHLLGAAGRTAVWPALTAAIVIAVMVGCLVFVMLVALFSADAERRRRAERFFKDLLGVLRRGAK